MIERLKAAWAVLRDPDILLYPYQDLAARLATEGQCCIARGHWIGDHALIEFQSLSWADTDAIKRYLGWS